MPTLHFKCNHKIFTIKKFVAIVWMYKMRGGAVAAPFSSQLAQHHQRHESAPLPLFYRHHKQLLLAVFVHVLFYFIDFLNDFNDSYPGELPPIPSHHPSALLATLLFLAVKTFIALLDFHTFKT